MHRFLPLLVCLVCLLALAPQSPAQPAYHDVPELPTGEVGGRIRELIDAINAHDAERTRAFVEASFTPDFRDFVPMEQHLRVFANLWEQSHGLDFHAVREYEGEAPVAGTVVVVRNRLTESWEALAVAVEEGPPYRIAGVQLLPARPPSDLPPPKKLSDPDIAARLEAFVTRLAQEDVFSGTVLLARDGEVLYRGAYGLASRRYGVPNRVDTKLNLGSMNKMFTAVALMQLVEQGKVDLHDRLSEYLSEDWLPRDVTTRIRIEHLLTHTSGLGSYFNDRFWESSRALYRELDDYQPLVAEETLAFEPGSDWRYSNTGMLLVGVVIEKASGENYFDYVREHVYKPAGMADTDCYDMDRPVPNLAIGYTQEDGEWRNNLFLHVIRGGPAGGGFSTVEDLLRFDQALRHHKLLTAESTELVWSAKPELGSPQYGFGFGLGGEPGDRVVGHSGGFAGISANLDMFLDSGYTSAVLSNFDRAATIVSGKIRELIAARRQDE